MDEVRKRLISRMKELGMSRAELDRKAGLPSGAIRDFLDRDQTPAVDRMARIATAIGYTLGQLYDGLATIRVNLRIDGVTKGDGMWAQVAERHARIIPLTFVSEDTVSVEISEDDEAPGFGYRRGDVVSGQRTSGTGLSNHVGLECIIQTEDGRRLLGVLVAGSKAHLYNVRPLNIRNPEWRDLRIEWAAPIRVILRGSN